MRETKFKFYYKGKLIEKMSLEEIALKCEYSWAKDVKVCQYTGLKDKNGVEIYEDDYLKIYEQAFPEFKGKIVSVVFEMGAFRDSYYKWNLCGKSHTFEIIGNVHEDQELIKGEEIWNFG